MVSVHRVAGIPLVVVLVLAMVAEAAAAQTPVRLSVSPRVATLGDAIEIVVEIDGEGKVYDLEVSPRGPLSSLGSESNVRVINFEVFRSTIERFRFDPTEVGTYTVGPAIVDIDGRRYRSNTVKVQVQHPGAERYLAIAARVTPPRVYEGEPFAYVVEVTHGTDLNPRSWSPPEPAGVRLLDPDQDTLQGEDVVTIGGRAFRRVRAVRWLIPDRAGRIDLAGGRIELELPPTKPTRQQRGTFDLLDPFGLFARTRPAPRLREVLPATFVTVRPLPPLPPKRDFVGLVGRLRVGWRDVHVADDRATATLVWQGLASTAQLRLNSWTQSGWRMYPEAPRQRVAYDEAGMPGLTIEQQVTFVPSDAADSELPVWFDSELGSYRLLTLPLAARTRVQSAAVPASAPSSGVDTAKLTIALDAWWRRWLTPASLWGLGVLALVLASAAWWQERRPRRVTPPDWRGALAAALAKDTRAAWRDAHAACEAAARAGVPPPPALVEAIAAALYAPQFRSPAAAVRALQAAQMTTNGESPTGGTV